MVFMKHYSLRKNFKAHFEDENTEVRASIAFKTVDTHWLAAEAPSIILVSIHSAFNENLDGHLKMNALVSVIKNHMKGKITILFSDKAHLKTRSLNYENTDLAFEAILADARQLHHRFEKYFDGCDIAYWHKYICFDDHYNACSNIIKQLYEQDSQFRNHLNDDAETVYKAIDPIYNKLLFTQTTVEDILEQCICILVLAKKGYRFQFYPGKPYAAIEYIIKKILSDDERIDLINVFISIEKKTFIKNHLFPI